MQLNTSIQHHRAPARPCGLCSIPRLPGVVAQAAGGPGKKGPSSKGKPSGGSKPSKSSSSKPSGSGFSGSKKGGGSQGKGGGGGQAKKAATSAPQRIYVSSPVQVELQDELTPTEFAETPKWETWSNHVSGEWVGVYSAYTPWAGLPEPVWLDPQGKYMHTMLSRCLEERGRGVAGGAQEAGQEEELLLRKLSRAQQPAELMNIVLTPSQPTSQPAAAPPPSSPSTPDQPESATASEEEEEGEEGVEVEALTYNSQGVVVFDGGHYSAGPDYIGPPAFKMLAEDEEEDGGGSEGGGRGRRGWRHPPPLQLWKHALLTGPPGLACA